MFTATSGVISGMEDKAPIDYVRLFFDGMIHSETSRYVDQYLGREREHLQQRPKARAHEWRRAPLLLKEVEVFLALIIARVSVAFLHIGKIEHILHETCTNNTVHMHQYIYSRNIYYVHNTYCMLVHMLYASFIARIASFPGSPLASCM